MNIPELRIVVARQIGLPSTFDGSVVAYRELSPTQQTNLTKGMLDYIRNNPGRFTDAQVTTATVEGPRIQNATIEDTSFDWGLFADELGANVTAAGDQVASLGSGVLASVEALGKILPFVVVGAVLFFVFVKTKSAANT
jgi:hypothetical protein